MARKSPGLYTDIARSLKTEYLTLDGQLKAGLEARLADLKAKINS
jgi:hypothetical protein